MRCSAFIFITQEAEGLGSKFPYFKIFLRRLSVISVDDMQKEEKFTGIASNDFNGIFF